MPRTAGGSGDRVAHEVVNIDWTAATDWDGLTGLEGFEAMILDMERTGWRLDSMSHTGTGTTYAFTRRVPD